MRELIEKGKVTRGYLGVMIKDAKDFTGPLNLPDDKGALINDINPDTPAERAGLRPYDVVRKVNGSPVEDAADLMRQVADLPPGTEVGLEVWRDKKTLNVTVSLGEYPGSIAKAMQGDTPLGLRIQALTPDVAGQMGLKPGTKGVLVMSVEPASPADEASLTAGDVILEVAQKDVTTPDEFRQAVKDHAKPGQSVLVMYVRGSRTPDITVIKVPEEDKKE